MPIAAIFDWIGDTGIATAVRESTLAYPIIMALHLTSIAIFGGMILVTDLRLLNLAMKETPASDVIAQLRPWKYAGFAIVVICGLLLFAAKADKYYSNPYFLIKIALLLLTGAHALAFRNTVYRSPGGPAPARARLAAALSLILWLAIMSAGRWIAYYEAPRLPS